MRCRACGYHLTQLALSWSCDACEGLVPKPVPAPVQGHRINPVGLKGADLHRWLVANPGEVLHIRDARDDLHEVSYRGKAFGFGVRRDGRFSPFPWQYSEKDMEKWECIDCY